MAGLETIALIILAGIVIYKFWNSPDLDKLKKLIQKKTQQKIQKQKKENWRM